MTAFDVPNPGKSQWGLTRNLREEREERDERDDRDERLCRRLLQKRSWLLHFETIQA